MVSGNYLLQEDVIAVPAEDTPSPTDKEVEIISAPLEKQPKTPPPLTKPTSEAPKMPKTTVEKDKEKAVEVGGQTSNVALFLCILQSRGCVNAQF